MEKGSIVLVDFTGTDLVSGRVFDTTSEETAKTAGIHTEGHVYTPAVVIVGQNDLIKGMEETIEGLKEGEEKLVKIGPEKAFGERKRELVFVVPLKQFRERKIQPYPGLVVDINGRYGRVQTVSGGRVRVDFNSDLAGKEVEYKIRVVKELKTAGEQVDALVEKYFPLKEGKAVGKIVKGELEVKLPPKMPKEMQVLKDAFAKVATESIKGIKKVKYIEEFEKPVEKKAEKSDAKK